MVSLKEEKCTNTCDGAYAAGRNARKYVDAAAVELQAAKTIAETHIRRDPLGTSVMIASVAYMLGKLLARRR